MTAGDLGRAVRGRIVDDNNFVRLPRGAGRFMDGGQCSAQRRFFIMRWNDERDHGRLKT